MRFLTRVPVLVFFLFLFPVFVWATHNRAGEIHIRQTGPLTIEATIITWTKASSVQADRDTLEIQWGDGKRNMVVRANGGGEGIVLPNDIKYNLYIATHTYDAIGWYRISMTDPNRIAGIINVNPPSSDNVPFHIETIYSFQDPQFGGVNTTPYLLQPPIDNACIGRPFKHNPNAFDPDGDSLSYQLIVPLQSVNTAVPNYIFPNQIAPGSSNVLQLNPVTGDILWLAPQKAGEYNLAFIVISWRNGQAIDTTIRDMQIFVDDCENQPPDVTTIDRLCVVAGDTVEFEVKGTDPDTGDFIQLTALGGPLQSSFLPPNRATFTGANGWRIPPVTGVFRWITACEHISNQPYSVVFKAVDSFAVRRPGLADLETVEIKVVGPPPEGLQADADQGLVTVSWDKPYFCEDAPNNYFYGFSVWRREGSNPFDPDSCETGLAGRGYTELVFRTKQMANGRYVFIDKNVERGRTYCYRILAKFARISSGGYPYNLVESLPSDEICVQLPRDLPLITNVSVLTTSNASGQLEICWSKPLAADLDTIKNPGPYRYELLRATGFTGGNLQPVPGGSFVYNTFSQPHDTCFTDTGLNTADGPYHYQINFYTGGNAQPLGSTTVASSVFLTITSTDNTNLLSWQADVPWENYRYIIYRFNTATGQFDSVGQSKTPMFTDRGLENGQEYCYYVRTVGTYSISGVIDPILNNSQEACGTPLDTLPPCVPTLRIGNLCNGQPGPLPDPAYENNLSWNNVNETCTGTDDAVRYRLWFAPLENAPVTLLTELEGADNITFVHIQQEQLAGCYTISAVDSNGNESARAPLVCVDNCPQYELPNVFTPNDDEQNDLYTPFPGWRFIDHVEFQVFNRWGNLVFETRDAALNWNGRDTQGNELAEGTYFYVCKVYESRVQGVILQSTPLSGYIELMRGGR